MRQGHASRTAEYNAAFRALESARPPSLRLLHDPYSDRLLPPDLKLLRRASSLPFVRRGLTAFVDRRWPGMRSSVVARTRLIDDWLTDAVRDETDQVVMLGAGLDTRAWRLQALARTIVYEVDHPSTSAAKQQRLASWHADLRRVRFVQVDFDRQSLAERLADSGFDPTRRTIVVWDGVTNYLQADAVDAVMRWVGGLAPTSQFIFTYIHAGVLDGSAHFTGVERLVRTLRRSGEPWTFGLRPETVADYLAARGLRLIADQGAADYRPKIMGEAARRITGYEFYHAARAEVMNQARTP
jgi:methyltransferase (TIGR00027 family)